MENGKSQEKAVRELIIINNDRHEGYNTAIKETNETDLKELFSKYGSQSREFNDELRRLSFFTEGAPTRDETKLSGKLFRIWMDIRVALTAKDRHAILASCEYGEDVAKQTYDDVLRNYQITSASLLTVVKKQREELQKSHDVIKSLRERAKREKTM